MSSPASGTTVRLPSIQTTESAQYSLLRNVVVQRAVNGEALSITDAWQPAPGKKTVLAFLTHFGDFNAWEYAQKLQHHMRRFEAAGVEVVAIGIGTLEGAREFAQCTGFPLSKLLADTQGTAYDALEFSRGFEPQLPGGVKVNPYLRLLTMLSGIGSPGTLQAVLKGYIGEKSADKEWVGSVLRLVEQNAFDTLGTEGTRPFEVATVRLQNMIQILQKWDLLTPPNKDLITQQGGTLVFEDKAVTYEYKDKGILVYTPIEEVLANVQA